MIILAWIEFIILIICTIALFVKLMDGVEETKSYACKRVTEPPKAYGLSWLDMQIATWRVLHLDRKRPIRCQWKP